LFDSKVNKNAPSVGQGKGGVIKSLTQLFGPWCGAFTLSESVEKLEVFLDLMGFLLRRSRSDTPAKKFGLQND